ncbi:MAG: HlyD family type I secretion periplasmic adaptor subunit [Arcobacter sp.]|uniref:HlyD family type I secretion periplasmic adaptor subunit n=1 Tax=Arcobacter sp. TaxID=1872629 RepID=UPI00258D2337|nr:HlyD family type I secretion periplasmic adaptor subunit [Arcobacter sp.]MDD3007316.1 HlyD family type I secretion periplasmic adaptor subunit [Arcobacter sp.]
MKEINNLPPDENTSEIVKFGFIVIIIVFIFLGGWMTYAPLAIYSIAIGKVSADFNKKRVQHLESGIIKKIYVKDGDLVKKNQILIKLDDIQIKSQLESLKFQYENILALESRLIAQKNNKKELLINNLVTNIDVIKEHQNLFYTNIESIKKNKQILNNQISQLRNQIIGIDSTLKSKEYMKESILEEINELEKLYEKKLINKINLRKMQREETLLTSEIINLEKEKIRYIEKISELETKKILIDEDFKKETLEELTSISSKISDLKLKISALEDTLNKTTIYAPSDGYIVGLANYTQDSIIKAGTDILEIVPNDSSLIIVGQIQSTDIDKINIGLQTNIIFSAYNTQKSHSIEGEVIYVSADSFTDPNTNESFYEIKAQLSEKGIEQIKLYNFNLVAGMPAEMMIKTGERTALSYLVKPLFDRFNRSFNEE